MEPAPGSAQREDYQMWTFPPRSNYRDFGLGDEQGLRWGKVTGSSRRPGLTLVVSRIVTRCSA